MDPIARVLLGGMALFILWTLLRAARTGVVYSRGFAFNAEQSPTLFTLCVLCHAGGMVFFAALAAGLPLAAIEHYVMAGLHLAP